MNCPLCNTKQAKFFTRSAHRVYHKCTNCHLIFVPPIYFLDHEAELKRYNLHQNTIDDAGYLRFISQIIPPLVARVPAKSKGLDFGSGPTPVLASLLISAGFKIDYYDPYYAKNKNIFTQKYDFITLTEVAEHLYNPAVEFKRLISLLKPKGQLFIMTSRTDTITNFKDWHYQNDRTHVCFYAAKTFDYLAETNKMSVSFINDRIVILKSL